MSDKPSPRRFGLFAPFVLLLIVIGGWSLWWVYLTGQVRDRLDLQVETLRRAGWTVTRERSDVAGWPFRARVETGAFRIVAPSGHAVSAPGLIAQANAWNPDKWVIVAPDGLTLTRAAKGDVAVTGRLMRMSASGLAGRWPRLALELADPVFAPAAGAEPFPLAGARLVQMYLRPDQASAEAVDVMMVLEGGRGRPGGPILAMANDGLMDARIEAVVARADRIRGGDASGILSAWSRDGGRFTAVRGRLSAGESRAMLSSEVLSADPDGRLNGVVAVDAVKPLPALAGLIRAGGGDLGATGALATAAATGPAAVDGATAGSDSVKLSVAFREGRAWLGPFPLAPAPKLF